MFFNYFSKKLFRKNRNAKILPSSSQSSGSDKSQPSSNTSVTTAGGVILAGVHTYASSYTRKTGMDPRDPIFHADVRTGNSRQVIRLPNYRYFVQIYIKLFIILLINIVPSYNCYHLFIQVTPRQRQEIYSLNRIMTRLENDRFKKFCQEKGFKGDLQIEDYDIFM